MRPVRHHFGITTFGATTWTAENAGDRLINEHDENDMGVDELYLVIQGRARFEVDGEQVDAPTGTFVYAPPEVKRTAVAEEAGTTIFAVGGAAPGKPYQVEGWELWAPMMRLFHAGEYAQAADWGVERLKEDETFTAGGALQLDPAGKRRVYLVSGSFCTARVSASSGNSRNWPTLKWLGSAIRLRLRSRISSARWASPRVSRAMERSVS